MKSKLNITEFRNILKENTAIGSPKIKLSPFGMFTVFNGFSKTFYGIFDDSTFYLTTNSTFFPTFYIIKGKYKNSNQTLNINYTVEPKSKFQSVWYKLFPIISLIMINLPLFNDYRKKSVEEIILTNLCVILIIIYAFWDIKRKRKNLEQRFIETFKIE